MRGQEILQSTIDEFHRIFKLLNEKYFNEELERPIITISRACGRIKVNKAWFGKDEKWFGEINICAEYLNRPTDEVITAFLHEMCHLWNIQQGIKDTSNDGLYHNAKFKKVAERSGLIVEKSDKYGFCMTKPSDKLKGLIKSKVCLERIKIYKIASMTKKSRRKYTCPGCGLIIQATKDLTGILFCKRCKQDLVES